MDETILRPRRPRKQHEKKTDGEDGRQAAEGQTFKDLLPVFETTGHGGCIRTGD